MQCNGPAIRALRQRSGLNVSALAVAAGIRQPHMSLIEKGDRQPSEETLVRIAQALQLDDLRAVMALPTGKPIPVPTPERERVA
jgi:transcriptional regulator with XRE-family HTH domain